MKFVAEIRAVCPIENKLFVYTDVVMIPVTTIDEANEWCQNNYKGYMKIVGIYVGEYRAEWLKVAVNPKLN